MATRSNWEAIYGFAVRRDINLTNNTAVPAYGASATTVTNTGLVRGSGTNLFVLTGVYSGFMVSAPIGGSTTTGFGLELTNRPSWVPNQALIISDKAIGEAVATAGTGYNYLRGIIGPTGSVQFQVTPNALVPFLWCLVHTGAGDAPVTGTFARHSFWLPASTDTGVEAFVTALERFSTNAHDSQLLTDSVVIKLTISGTEGGAIEATADLMGRYLVNNYIAADNASLQGTAAAPQHNAPNLNFAEISPLLFQNMELVLQSSSTSYIVTECSGFSLTITCEIVAKRYNSRFPIRYIIQGYTVEGTLSIPWGATTVGGNLFLEQLINTAATNDSSATAVTTSSIDFLWKTTKHGIGQTFATTDGGVTGTIATSARAMIGANDMRIGVGAIITAAPNEGTDETMINLSFTGVNVRSDNIITSPAFALFMNQPYRYGIGYRADTITAG